MSLVLEMMSNCSRTTEAKGYVMSSGCTIRLSPDCFSINPVIKPHIINWYLKYHGNVDKQGTLSSEAESVKTIRPRALNCPGPSTSTDPPRLQSHQRGPLAGC